MWTDAETQLIEKLRGVPGRYIVHEKGMYTLRESDGNVLFEMPSQFVDDLTYAGGLVQYENRDPQKLFPAPAFG
jgi:hypothetical protein